jgi:hypothetical protein
VGFPKCTSFLFSKSYILYSMCGSCALTWSRETWSVGVMRYKFAARAWWCSPPASGSTCDPAENCEIIQLYALGWFVASCLALRSTPPPDREPQTGHQELDTGPVAAHRTFKIFARLSRSCRQSGAPQYMLTACCCEVAVASPSYALGASNVPQCQSGP